MIKSQIVTVVRYARTFYTFDDLLSARSDTGLMSIKPHDVRWVGILLASIIPIHIWAV